VQRDTLPDELEVNLLQERLIALGARFGQLD